jgi:septal ring factor EnvC (AmiA/AmiB activator)
MTDSQQDTALQRQGSPLTLAGDRNEHAQGGTDSPVQKAIAQAKDQLAALHHQRATTLEGLQNLEAAIEKSTLAVNAADSTKLTNLHAKRRSFEQRLEELASQEEILSRHLEALVEKEQLARIEDAAKRRKQIQKDGRAIADTIRHTVGLLGKQVAELLELKNRERVCQDVLRSLAPERMQECHTFAYACAVDDNFQIALGEVISECRRSASELLSRGQPLPVEMQERIVREQAR